MVGLLTWWYGAGWKLRVLEVRNRLYSTLDYFSIDLLLRTLFSPFRQISAGKVQGPLGVQLRAFVDQLISRCIGCIVRCIVIVVGIGAITLTVVLGGVLVVAWAFLPIAPLIGFTLAVAGWMPWIL